MRFGYEYVIKRCDVVKIVEFEADNETEAHKKAMNFAEKHDAFVSPLGQLLEKSKEAKVKI